MKNLLRTLVEDIKCAMHALSHHSHGSEMLRLRDKHHILSHSMSQIKTSGKFVHHVFHTTPSKRVVLAVNQTIDLSAFRYALDTAEREEAQLDILTRLDKTTISEYLDSHFDGLPEHCTIIPVKHKDLLKAISFHTAQHEQVICVVASEKDAPTEGYFSQARRHPTQAPLLLISDGTRAA